MFQVQHMKNLSGVNVAPFLDTIWFNLYKGPFHTGEGLESIAIGWNIFVHLHVPRALRNWEEDVASLVYVDNLCGEVAKKYDRMALLPKMPQFLYEGS
jgi:hypothetical protein